ncbi:Mut7-C RNAse domain-containing protein [uncultured Modestobacter sp.]|uniref:Mut7-C RNAse domain-containing protein n=1 Tax=uncultured Modestobacter sp. TaxID=380048 RepID=UPI00262227DE|nr:Mut7-C RNAse domain-containing protein [uncultured Modestobacter sp.]
MRPAHRATDGGPTPTERAVVVRLDPDLRWLLPPRYRTGGERALPFDPDATVGHLVQAAGVPLTEAGRVLVDGVAVDLTARTAPGAVLEVVPAGRPQPVPAGGFLLDVGLGSLARRLRLLGLDAAWRNDADDPELVAQAVAEDRVLLTQDRGLLMRRALPRGALVRGSGTDAQLADVLDRFVTAPAPLTRCTACNGELAPVPKAEIADQLEPGTRRTVEEFSRCTRCGRVYWRGAHAARIDELVAGAAVTPAGPTRRGARGR